MPTENSEHYRVILLYPERDLLQSGWLIGKKYLSLKAAMIKADYGQGKVILFGFRLQHRAQTHGNFKLLFKTFIQ